MTVSSAVVPSQPVATGIAAAHFAATSVVADQFFREHADAIARACGAMAARFAGGGRLFVAGDGAQRSDVGHVVVEFMHPVVVGKRALPAIALPDIEEGDARWALATLARSGDLFLALSATSVRPATSELLTAARGSGLLTIALTGGDPSYTPSIDHRFAVSSSDACIVQETHEMLYHVLWELVHVFFEHRPVRS